MRRDEKETEVSEPHKYTCTKSVHVYTSHTTTKCGVQ